MLDYEYIYDENYDFYQDYWDNEEYDIINYDYFDDFDYYYGTSYVYEKFDNYEPEEDSFLAGVWDSWGW